MIETFDSPHLFSGKQHFPTYPSDQQSNLLSGTVHTLDQDIFDIGGLGWAGAPDNVWSISEYLDCIRNCAMDFFLFDESYMHPQRKGSEPMRGLEIIDNQRS